MLARRERQRARQPLPTTELEFEAGVVRVGWPAGFIRTVTDAGRPWGVRPEGRVARREAGRIAPRRRDRHAAHGPPPPAKTHRKARALHRQRLLARSERMESPSRRIAPTPLRLSRNSRRVRSVAGIQL